MSQQQGSTPDFLALPGLGDEEEDGGPAAAAPPSPPWWRSRGAIIAAGLLGILILGLFIFLLTRPGRRQIPFQMQPVTRGNLVLSISATGPLQGGIYNVVFMGTGKIAQLDVVEGQAVKKGQVLAKLDMTSLRDAVNFAEANYLAAVSTLNSDEADLGATEGQGGANIVFAETGLRNAIINLQRVVVQGQATVQAAQTTVTNAQANLQAFERQGQASVQAAQAAVTNAQANLQAAEQQAQASVNVAQAQPVPTSCPTAVPPPPATPPPATPTPPPCPLATAQVNLSQANAQVNVTMAEATLNTAEAALNTAQAQATTNDVSAQTQVNTALSGLNTAQRQADLNNATAQNAANAAQSQLGTSVATADLSDTSSQGILNAAQSQVKTTLTQLQTAEHNLGFATLFAPHAGTVTVINGTVGGTPGVPKNILLAPTGTSTLNTFIQVVDPKALQVVADVNESDTGSLKVGDTAQFTVSAYGNRAFSGVVSYIAPSGVSVANVVTFPVYVDVDTTDLQGATLLPGMTGNVAINVAKRTNVLLIPVNAVNYAHTASTPSTNPNAPPPLITADKVATAQSAARQLFLQWQRQNPTLALTESPTPTFVLEERNGQLIAKPVVLGLTDGTNYEVLLGLSPGEVIIVGPGGSRAPTGFVGGAGGG